MENKKETVCAVVVTYNRKKLLLECLEAIRKQTRPVDAIYIIDNASEDGTPEALKENGYISELLPSNLSEPYEIEHQINNLIDGNSIKIFYVRMHKNTGGSGGFYEGVKRGYEKGYDWLWLMDDDAEPKIDALEKLESFMSVNTISALACLKVDKSMKILQHHMGYFNLNNVFSGIIKCINENDIKNKKFIEIDFSSFVGILIKKEAITQVGLPKKDFFIHDDDVEYCIRLRQIGKILLIPDSIIIHKEAVKDRILEKSFLGIIKKRVEFNKFWLSYYGLRNRVWLGKIYSKNKVLFYIQMIKSMIRPIVGIILYDDHKYKRIKLILSAYLDGLKGEFDNKKPKRILYEE